MSRRDDDWTPERDRERMYDWLNNERVALEVAIRRKQVQPRPGDKQQQRWADEGDVPSSRLDTVRGAK